MFQSECKTYSCLNVKELFASNKQQIWSLRDCNGSRTNKHLVCKRTLNHLAQLTKWLSCVVSTYPYGAFDCMFLSCHVRASEWIHTLYSCMNVMELIVCNRRQIWSLSNCKGTLTHNHLVRKQTLNHLATLAKWLSCVVTTYQYGGINCMILSCQVRFSEWNRTL